MDPPNDASMYEVYDSLAARALAKLAEKESGSQVQNRSFCSTNQSISHEIISFGLPLQVHPALGRPH